jgi:serine/threonine protein kinase
MYQQIEDITLLRLLGKGSYGEVYLSLKQNALFATKKVKRKKTDDEMTKYFKNEINILRILNHPNIVKLEEIKMDENNYYIVMEYINGGELSDYLKKYIEKYGKPFSEEIVQYLMKQIISALIYIHDLNIIHRDLKLENIMVDFDNEKDKEELNMMKAKIKIIDFGFAIMLSSKFSLTNSAVGTFMYMDPKILKEFDNQVLVDKSRGYGKEVDIWSLGCICYQLFRGKYPFEAKTFEELVGKIDKGKYRLPTTASREIISFLDKMLKYKGKDRLSAKELINEPFLVKNFKDFTYMPIKHDKRQQNQNINKGDAKFVKCNSVPIHPNKEEDISNQSKNNSCDRSNMSTVSGSFSYNLQSNSLNHLNPQPQMQSQTFQMPRYPINVPIQPPFQNINYAGTAFGPFQRPAIQTFQNPSTYHNIDNNTYL